MAMDKIMESLRRHLKESGDFHPSPDVYELPDHPAYAPQDDLDSIWDEDDPRWEQVQFKEDYLSYFTGAVNRFEKLMRRNPVGRKAYIAALKDFISQAEASE